MYICTPIKTVASTVTIAPLHLFLYLVVKTNINFFFVSSIILLIIISIFNITQKKHKVEYLSFLNLQIRLVSLSLVFTHYVNFMLDCAQRLSKRTYSKVKILIF